MRFRYKGEWGAEEVGGWGGGGENLFCLLIIAHYIVFMRRSVSR